MSEKKESSLFDRIDKDEASSAMLSFLRELEDFKSWDIEKCIKAINIVMDADISYMREAKIENGGIYDEDISFKKIEQALKKEFSNEKNKVYDLADFLMEAWEIYLNTVGLINWV